MSAGGFFRASERRALLLPPLWALGRPRPAPPVFPYAGHRSMDELADWPDAPRPDFIVPEPIIDSKDQTETAGAGDQSADNGGGREARAPEGSRRAAPADIMDPANARECHISQPAAKPGPAPRPVARTPIAERIDLAQASSAMEDRAEAVQQARRGPEPLPVQPSGHVPCRCGSRDSGKGAGLVPAWFGRDCIERDCPLKGGAHG